MKLMNRAARIAVAAGALMLAANVANAAAVSWNFGTSGGTLLNPGGSFGAPAVGFNDPIGANGQMAVFESNNAGLFVGANAYSNGGDGAVSKVTQRNNADYGQTGIGVCSTLCDPDLRLDVSNTEWLRISLNNPNAGATDHDGWDLESIVFGNVNTTPAFQLEFWFSDGAVKSTAIANKNFATQLQVGDVCDTLVGTSCFFDLSGFDASINDFDYLWITAGPNVSPQPQILLTQLNGVIEAVAAPEPATLALLGAGLLALGWAKRRKPS